MDDSKLTLPPMKVYVAGPYTKGDVAVNVRTAMNVGEVLFHEGYIPYIPHLTHFWHLVHPKPAEDWYAYDMHWLRVCDAVVRIDGVSVGADAECFEAERLGIPVLSWHGEGRFYFMGSTALHGLKILAAQRIEAAAATAAAATAAAKDTP